MNLRRETHWVCPYCTATDVTTIAQPHSRFHTCRGLAGITAPFVQDGVRCHVEVNERDDYIGGEIVTLDGNGRPIMNISTEYADGSNDLAVFAPTARIHFGGDNA